MSILNFVAKLRKIFEIESIVLLKFSFSFSLKPSIFTLGYMKTKVIT